jgi:hypothetical protein
VLKWLYEKVTGTPWTTTPAWASRDGVRLVGAVYRDELAGYTDAELYARGDQILAQLRRQRATGQTGNPGTASHFVGASGSRPLLPPSPGGSAARRLAPVTDPPCQPRVGLGLPLKAGAGRVSIVDPPQAAVDSL